MDIELTAGEQELWLGISAYLETIKARGNRGEFLRDQIGPKQRKFTRFLLDREAIPARRLLWVNDANYQVGLSRSRWAILKENSRRSGDAIFEVPSWGINYLPFLLGIFELPQDVVTEFRSDAANKMNNGYDLGMEYRAVAKERGLRKAHAVEFHKLALDCGLDHQDCRSIRDLVFQHLKH